MGRLMAKRRHEQVLQAMTEEQRRGLDPIKLRRKARDFATKTVKSQRNQFQRYASCLPSRVATKRLNTLSVPFANAGSASRQPGKALLC